MRVRAFARQTVSEKKSHGTGGFIGVLSMSFLYKFYRRADKGIGCGKSIRTGRAIWGSNKPGIWIAEFMIVG
jgi:hypothetical protein